MIKLFRDKNALKIAGITLINLIEEVKKKNNIIIKYVTHKMYSATHTYTNEFIS